MCKVDFGWLFREKLNAATGIFIALLESLEGGYGLPTKTEGVGYFRPVELKGCTAL